MTRATGCQDGRADRRADSPPDLGGARRVRAEDGYGIQEGSECSEPGWLQDPNSPSLILGGGGGAMTSANRYSCPGFSKLRTADFELHKAALPRCDGRNRLSKRTGEQ